jgi:hypothetical protein
VRILSTARLDLVIAILFIPFSAAAQVGQNQPPVTVRSTAEPQRKHPRRIKPPRTPRDHGLRIALTAGMNSLVAGGYNYTTQIIMPDGQQLQYTGTQTAPGGSMSAGIEITPPGILRRFTAGLSVNGGGFESWARPVTPSNAPTPFSLLNLQLAIQSTIFTGSGWRADFSPYVEHELGNLLGSRMRLGYQYWAQTGGYKGYFFPIPGSRIAAEYDVRLNYSSHLVRLTFNNFTNLDDSDVNFPGSHRSKRRYGLLQQIGILGGTHRSFMIFFAVGPFWSF